MARQGRRDDSRSRSRGRTMNYRGRSRSRPSQHQHQRRQDSLELPRSWKSTPTEYDSNREYGLNLPRQVVSNKFTRELRIDGMDIFDVRLAQVMTGGLNNWGLRSCLCSAEEKDLSFSNVSNFGTWTASSLKP